MLPTPNTTQPPDRGQQFVDFDLWAALFEQLVEVSVGQTHAGRSQGRQGRVGQGGRLLAGGLDPDRRAEVGPVVSVVSPNAFLGPVNVGRKRALAASLGARDREPHAYPEERRRPFPARPMIPTLSRYEIAKTGRRAGCRRTTCILVPEPPRRRPFSCATRPRGAAPGASHRPHRVDLQHRLLLSAAQGFRPWDMTLLRFAGGALLVLPFLPPPPDRRP